MEWLVTFDAESQFGRFLLALHGKPGGSFDLMNCGLARQPVVVCKDIDWVTCHPFVRMTHLRSPAAADQMPTDLIVPASTILFAVPKSALIPAPQQEEPQPAVIPPAGPVH